MTTKRVEWVCQKAAGETLEPNCVDAIFYGMGLMPVLGSTPPVPLWLLLDPSGTHQADCGYLANFFILCCRMLGVSAPMTKGYIYPLTAGLGGRWSLSSNDTEYRLVTDPPPHAGGFSHPHATYNVVEMLLWSGSEGGTNKYEGAVLYNGKYYCVGFDAYAHPSLAMYALVDKTFWVYQTSSTTWYYCINPPDPGPYPEWDW
ncbi:MAG: hypothetical protein JXQ73_09695 [Phycisphaerae bacterium]|nr:hypothetical protein [Phycisphaerae bacterium]